eukprot:TRINITY_DN10257_c0_g1_i1.p1 TRINITY_DN10257_c0_g1~~TRINITY_DN10257_c0_g1_i1.p1  ORF type:complete len:549 (-),score=46.08 TRINITY_DN10257_c0_g1_i1:239-1885(-)
MNTFSVPQLHALGAFTGEGIEGKDYCICLTKTAADTVEPPISVYEHLVTQLHEASSTTLAAQEYSTLLDLIHRYELWKPLYESQHEAPVRRTSTRKSERKRKEKLTFSEEIVPTMGTEEFLEHSIHYALRAHCPVQNKETWLLILDLMLTMFERDILQTKRVNTQISKFLKFQREYNNGGEPILRQAFSAIQLYTVAQRVTTEFDEEEDCETTLESKLMSAGSGGHSLRSLRKSALYAVRLLGLIMYSARGSNEVHHLILPQLRLLDDADSWCWNSQGSPKGRTLLQVADDKLSVLHFILQNLPVSVHKLDWINFILDRDYQPVQTTPAPKKKRRRKNDQDDSILDISLTPQKKEEEDPELSQAMSETSIQLTPCSQPQLSLTPSTPDRQQVNAEPVVAKLRRTALTNAIEVVRGIQNAPATRSSQSKSGFTRTADFEGFALLLYHCVITCLEIVATKKKNNCTDKYGPEKDILNPALEVLDVQDPHNMKITQSLLEAISELFNKLDAAKSTSFTNELLEFLHIVLGGSAPQLQEADDSGSTESEGLG